MQLKKTIENLKNEPGFTLMKLESLVEKHALSPLNLTNINLKILMVIIAYGKVSQRDILQYIPTTPANLSQRIDKMFKQKLITRKGALQDRRKTTIVATAKGKSTFEKALKHVLEIKKIWLRKFTKQELEAYNQFNLKLKNLLPLIEEELERKKHFGK